MTQETYHVEREGDDKEDKKEEEDKKKKSVAFKASSSSSKNKGKSKKESSDDDDLSDIDDEAMALFVRKMEKFWMGTRLLESGGVRLMINQSVVPMDLEPSPKERSVFLLSTT